MAEGDTLVNALIGAVVSAVVGFVLPFGPLFGGLAAGYLQAGTRSDGLRVGAYSGIIGLIPAILIGAAVFFLVGIVFIGVGVGEFLAASFFTGLVVVLIVLALAAYFVGFGALGGYLGNYVKYETDI
ncbi:hypothetical protein BRC74_04390 [Halobacteriales archaeon QH_7_68_42]|jgi:hypothetical protein|nr:MAG: hypothetical protein BRC74_04390 [Halobacteriales archaeon QH_7_68_42]PSP70386.1 MAG: hypothetical protein BRC70_05695 [Halobacteriales archaeon QH_6_68_27]